MFSRRTRRNRIIKGLGKIGPRGTIGPDGGIGFNGTIGSIGFDGYPSGLTGAQGGPDPKFNVQNTVYVDGTYGLDVLEAQKTIPRSALELHLPFETVDSGETPDISGQGR